MVWMIQREGFVYFSFTDEHRLHSGKLCLIILTCIAEVGVNSLLILVSLLQSAIFFSVLHLLFLTFRFLKLGKENLSSLYCLSPPTRM